jgi:LytS/YehU family sensor histidine kinase
MIGFIVSCAVVQVVSWMLIADPRLRWPIYVAGGPGIPVRDYIAQSGEFIVCAFLLAALALTAWQNERRWPALALAVLAVSFLFNVIAVTSSRTAIVVIRSVAAVRLAAFVMERIFGSGSGGGGAGGVGRGGLPRLRTTSLTC